MAGTWTKVYDGDRRACFVPEKTVTYQAPPRSSRYRRIMAC